MDTALVAALASAAALASGGLFGWLAARRTTRGQVDTSEAAVLWQQSQAMTALLVQQRDRAETQRDRLIDSQANSVLPALEGINVGLGAVSDGLARNSDAIARAEIILARIEERSANGSPESSH